jgi:hypothetical protein
MLPEAFRVNRFQLTLTPTAPLHLPAFHGATLRGGFGYAFKRAVCVARNHDCGQCLLKTQCAYAVMFETSPPPGSQQLRTLSDVPRPFVLEPPSGARRDYAAGEPLEVGLVLVGRALDYLPYFVFTFQQLGETGLGRERVPFELSRVAVGSSQSAGGSGQEADGSSGATLYEASAGVLRDPPAPITGPDLCNPKSEIPNLQSEITLRFVTPTHLKIAGKPSRDLAFRDFMAALLRRLSSLCYFHCGVELELPFRDLLAQAERVETADSRLEWVEQHRFSTRQHQLVHADGAVGEITYTGELSPFLPFLLAGEIVHVGKGCVFGRGKYRLDPS